MKNSLAYPGIGERLRVVRERLGESQAVFAARFGLNRGNIDSYVRGRAVLPTKLIGQLIEMGVSAGWLIDGKGARTGKPKSWATRLSLISLAHGFNRGIG